LNKSLVPSTKSVTFISRTVEKEDNEAIISHILETEDNIDKFELKCVLPKFYNETNYDYEFSMINFFLFIKYIIYIIVIIIIII